MSVILPTYNRASTLARAIDSVLGQTYTDFELIVVDDGSTDATADLRRRYLKDARVHWLRQSHRGCSAARNAGLLAASGQYLAFQDSDDEWLPDKLAATYRRLAQSEQTIGVVYSDMWRIETGQRHYFQAPDIRRGRLINADTGDYQVYRLGVQTTLIRQEAAALAGLFDERLPRFTDLDWLIRLSDVCDFVRIAEPLVNYYATAGISTDRAALVVARKRLARKYRGRLLAQPDHLARQYWLIALAAEADGRLWQAAYFAMRVRRLPVQDAQLRAGAHDLLRRCLGQKLGGRVTGWS